MTIGALGAFPVAAPARPAEGVAATPLPAPTMGPVDASTFSPEATSAPAPGVCLGGLFAGLQGTYGSSSKPDSGSKESAAPVVLTAEKASEELSARLREDMRSSVQSVTGEMLKSRSERGSMSPTRVDQISLSNEVMGDIERERHIELPTPQTTRPDQVLKAGETLIDDHQKDEGEKTPADASQPVKRSVRQEEMMERLLARSTSVAQFRKKDEGMLRGVISGNLDRREARDP